MATKNKVFTVNFRAFDTAANEPKTGDSANISMFVRIDSGVVSGVTRGGRCKYAWVVHASGYCSGNERREHTF